MLGCSTCSNSLAFFPHQFPLILIFCHLICPALDSPPALSQSLGDPSTGSGTAASLQRVAPQLQGHPRRGSCPQTPLAAAAVFLRITAAPPRPAAVHAGCISAPGHVALLNGMLASYSLGGSGSLGVSSLPSSLFTALLSTAVLKLNLG